MVNAREETLDVDVRGLLMMFWRRRLTIAAMLMLGVSAAAIALFFIKPQFTARALLLIGRPQGAVMAGEDVRGAHYEASMILSEVEVLRSRTLARTVIQKLGLMNDPELNSKLRAAAPQGNFKSIELYGSEMNQLPPEVRDAQVADVVAKFLKQLAVRAVPGSYAIQLEFSSKRPGEAALITNAIADAYIEKRMETSFAATQKKAGWLNDRLSALRAELAEKETAVAKYKAEHNLLEDAGAPLSSQEISDLNGQLSDAKAKEAEAQAKLQQVNEQLKSPATMNSAAAVMDSDVIQKLKIQQAGLEGDLSELSTRYGPKHPEILKKRSEIAEIKNSIRGEMGTIARSATNELLLAAAKVKALEDRLSQSGGKKFSDDETMIGLRALQMEAETTQVTLDTFLKNYKSGAGEGDLQEPGAEIISYAIVPRGPSFPNAPLVLSLSIVVSIFIGLALAVLQEKLDNTFRSARQLESALGMPCYGLVPSAGRIKPPFLGRYALAQPSSPLAESVRSLRMVLNLRAARDGQKPGVIALTSSFPGEGKTTLSLWMGRLAAASGERVIIVDCDLRRPNLHKSAGRGNEISIVDYLSGQAPLKKIIDKDNDSGADLIFARSVPGKALDLVGSEAMKQLVASLREDYDLVIIDCPAALAVSDARVLATLADQVLYAVAWDRTPREAVAGGVKQFAETGSGAVGFVLTNVNVKKHARYGYGDTAAYYGKYSEKYAA